MRVEGRPAGQALVEFSLVVGLFLLALLSVIVLGLIVFYNQQVANAAREAARFASVHSATAQCPTVSRLDPVTSTTSVGGGYNRCDSPEESSPWPDMTAAGRTMVWGLSPSSVSISACWSGFVDPAGNADALPQAPNVFTDCTIGGVNPKTNATGLQCPSPATTAGSTVYKADGDDKASSISYWNGVHYPTTVTVYACANWTPPMAGFLFVPNTMTFRAVTTEPLQRQQ